MPDLELYPAPSEPDALSGEGLPADASARAASLARAVSVMRAAWDEVASELGWDAAASAAELERLVEAYSSAARAYHGCSHIARMLENLESWRRVPEDRAALVLSILYHDVIYDSRGKDNEERSADAAREAISSLGSGSHLPHRVAGLILETKSHAPPATDPDAQLLVDLDLEILASEPSAYEQYCRGIRHEYGWVPEENYAARRAEVMRKFLRKDAIFSPLASHLERAARDNIEAELRRLDGATADHGSSPG